MARYRKKLLDKTIQVRQSYCDKELHHNDDKLTGEKMALFDISGPDEMIADLLAEHWIKAQKRTEEDKIECHSMILKQAT